MDGVLLDEFVVKQLSHLSDESAVYYNAIFNEKLQNLISNDETEAEYLSLIHIWYLLRI